MPAGADPGPLLLERDAELARLTAVLDRARVGAGAVAVISGPAGIGKTELVAAVQRLASERGFRSLRARGRELETDMAFAVVRQLLEQPVLSAGTAERRRLLAGPATAGAGALGLAVGGVPASEFAAVHGLYWLCANLAERQPVLLTVDDLQWVDGPSLSWLAYLGPRATESKVLVVAAVREGDPRAQAAAVAAVTGDASVHRLGLSALSVASVVTLVGRELGRPASAEFCSVCWELAGGNPMYIRELIAAAHNQGLSGEDESIADLRAVASSAVGPSVLARLARMGPDAIALAQSLAVLGSQNEVAVAAELAGLDVAVAELAADELAAAQVLAPTRPLDFFHPLIGEAVYADLALGARRLAHRHAATILDRSGAVDRVAAHLLAAGPAGDAWVTERLSAAARDARRRGAPAVAASYLRRALTEPPGPPERPALLMRLGAAEWDAGEPPAIAHLEEAMAQAADAPTIAGAAGALANCYAITDQTDMAVAVLQRAIKRIDTGDPPRVLALEAASALAGVMDDRTAAEALHTADRLRTWVDDLADPPVRLLVATAQIAMRRNQPAEAERLVARVLACKPYPPPLDACTSTIVTMIGLEAFDTLQRLCEDMLAQARRRAAERELTGIASFSAWALRQRGELADAEAQARWVLERASGIYAIDAVAHLVETLIERDALDDADTELRRTAPLRSHSITVVTYLMARGRLRSARGRPDEALADFLDCGDRCERLHVVLAMYHWRSEAALAHDALGNADEALRLARSEVALARAFGRPRALGVALRGNGLVEGGTRGLTLLAEAVSVLERSRAPVELARALTDHGAALRRAGQRGEARVRLERGLDLAHHWGARRIANLARAELVAAGAKPRRDAVTGRDALTASELRVARLAAEGRSNREIAQALFITTKTASAHLSRVYRKLDAVGIEIDRGLVVTALLAAGYQVFAVNPLASARYRERHVVSGAKSDRGDAKVLADLVRTDRHNHRPVAGDSGLAEAVRILARAHQSAVSTNSGYTVTSTPSRNPARATSKRIAQQVIRRSGTPKPRPTRRSSRPATWAAGLLRCGDGVRHQPLSVRYVTRRAAHRELAPGRAGPPGPGEVPTIPPGDHHHPRRPGRRPERLPRGVRRRPATAFQQVQPLPADRPRAVRRARRPGRRDRAPARRARAGASAAGRLAARQRRGMTFSRLGTCRRAGVRCVTCRLGQRTPFGTSGRGRVLEPDS